MKKLIFENRIMGIVFITICNLLVYLVSYAIVYPMDNLVLQMMIFDLAATVLIYLISLCLHNSSLYDPYWSVTPGLLAVFLAFQFELNIYHYIFLGIFLLWSIRLTINWAITFTNLRTEDWRYQHFRLLKGIKWQLANFFGIMMIPTIFVFFGFIPVYYFLSVEATSLSLIGSGVILLGIGLEFFADHQIHHFIVNTKEKVTCEIGLWRYTRHPNYLGEISVWIGTFLVLVLTDLSKWYYCLGACLMIFLFNCISIPLMEKRQLQRRSDYALYQKTTSRLLILPKKALK